MFNDLPKFVFLTGKDGVGNISLACAAAVGLADAGKKVLLVSTDPASNVGQVFGVEIGNKITPITAVPGLQALEIDPEGAAAEYRERIVGPMRGVLPEKALKEIEEQLSGACTTEIAAFDEFTALLTDDAVTGAYDHIIFDTAPTGHTLLLLDATGFYHCDVLRHAGDNVGHMTMPMMRLQDPDKTRILIVTLPETTPVLEAARLQEDLRRAGITPYAWVVNASLAATGTMHPVLAARAETETPEIAKVRDGLVTRHAVVPMQAEDPVGMTRLRALVGRTAVIA